MVRRRVRSLLLVLPALFLLLLLPRAGQAQEGAISGTVTDLTGLGLSAVEVEVLRADGSVLAGDLSTSSGSFRITNVPTGTYTVQFTLAGWSIVEQENVVVRTGETTSVNAGLSERSFNLNPITVTTSRRVEKALDAPAAVEVVSREAIEARPALTPVDHVREQAGVDYVILDGRGGATGAAPLLFRDNISVPTIPALARARHYLESQGRSEITLIITGGLRTPADFIKALCLGADGIAIANAAIQAIGCIGARICYTNNCPSGIATQREDLRARLDVEDSAARLARFLESSTQLMATMARACGHRDLKAFTQNDLTTWKKPVADLTGISFAGVG
jgi:hypothetical protein